MGCDEFLSYHLAHWSQDVCHPAVSSLAIPETLSKRSRTSEDALRCSVQRGLEPSYALLTALPYGHAMVSSAQ